MLDTRTYMDKINSLYPMVVVLMYSAVIGMHHGKNERYKTEVKLRTTWMSHLGCFAGNLSSEWTKVKIHNLSNNQPKTCSRMCGNWPYFGLKNTQCFCFKEDVYKSLIETSNNCHQRCFDFTNYMYCGSTDKQYTTVYRRETGLHIRDSSNCLVVSKSKSSEARPCSQTHTFICENSKMIEEKRNFYDAKLFCENKNDRLMIINESVSHIPRNGVYWIGTFRQDVATDKLIEQTTTATKLTSTLSFLSTTLPTTMITTATKDITTTTEDQQITTDPVFNPIPTIRDGGIYNSESISRTMVNEKEHQSPLQCGTFCFILGICVCCVTIFGLVVCLFKIRQQWNVRLQKNINVINQDDGSRCDNDDQTKEGIPVYLDPANQRAVFNNRLPKTVNQHIYDEVKATDETDQVLTRQACISGYQDLHFATAEKDGHSKDVSNTKDIISAYDVPWGKLKLSGENRQNTKSYAGKQTTGAFPIKLRATNEQLRQDQDSQFQYGETMIDHKRYLYDSPQADIERKRKTEPWETYRYQHNESPESGGFAMASGRGLSVANKQFSKSKPVHGRRPDIIPYDNLSSKDVDSHIYETPEINVEKDIQVKEKVKDQGKFKKSKGASIKSKLLILPRYLQKYRRRLTVDVDGGYDVPNPVNPLSRFSKSRSIGLSQEINIPVQQSLTKHSHYELALPLADTNRDHSLKPAVCGKQITSSEKLQYESAMPIITRINNELAYNFNKSRAPQYGLAKPHDNKYKSNDASKDCETDKAIYFEPIG